CDRYAAEDEDGRAVRVLLRCGPHSRSGGGRTPQPASRLRAPFRLGLPNFRRSARRAEHGRNRGQGSWEGQVAGQGDLGVGLWRRGGAAKTRPIGGRRERPSRRLRGTGAGLARASLFPGEPKGLGPPSRDSPGAYGDWEPNAILLPIARAARG